jgi:two-component system response regulator (stage 0 sporulation protein F)
MPAKRILIVDDQRDVRNLLRSALETLGRDYVIVEAPSGEEALLEIGRGGADLLVIDVRLPGISGLDVVKRLRRTNTKAQVILISGMPNVQIQTEAEKLDVLAFVPKSDKMMDTFLPLVQRAVGDQPAARPAEEAQQEHAPAIADRLSTLRRDLGANAVFLSDMEGRITVRAGDIARLEMDAIVVEAIAAIRASLKTSQLLGGLIPSNVLFFDGDEYDVYAANVGQYYAIVIIFDGERGAGQMGPVMRYGRQCADDLLNSLVMLGVKMDEPVAFSARPAPAAPPTPKPAPAGRGKPEARPDKPARPEIIYKAASTAKPSAAPTPRPAPPPRPEPEPEPAPAAPARPLTEEELKALDEALNKVKVADANSFWDSLAEETEASGSGSNALSFEEAEKLGLVPKK